MERTIAFSFAVLALIWRAPAARFDRILRRRTDEILQLDDVIEKLNMKIAIAAEQYMATPWFEITVRTACRRAQKVSASTFSLWLEFFTGIRQ